MERTKRVLSAVLVLLAFGTALMGAPQAVQKTQSAAAGAQQQGITAGGWILFGADIALSGYAVYTLLDQRSAASDYDALFAAANDTTLENYQLLLDRKKQVDDKATLAGIAGGVAIAAVLYTAADYFWLHKVFPEGVKVTFSPAKKTAMISVERRF